jgi:hypothetical protein
MPSHDISHILAGWAYEEDAGLQVRRIRGRDGATRLQIRIDLGVLQLEATGRPDGTRPFGHESLLAYFREQAEAHRREHGWYEGFELDAADCAALRQESFQYYHRRIAWMTMQEYAEAIRDADHNLEILDLLKAFAREREDWLASEQYRAFILCHRIQSAALQHLQSEDLRAALLEVEQGKRRVREVFSEQERLDEYEESTERAVLDDLSRKLDARYQVSHRQKLHILLDDALRREDPDVAADLRSQLRALEAEE